MKLVVVLSGGMDSAVLLYKLAEQGHQLAALSVDYGQRHGRELACAAAIARRAGVPHVVAPLSGLRTVLPGSSQTDDSIPVPHGHYEDESMRLTVVPNRNMILLAVAAAHAAALGFEGVAYGAHAGDHAIYPDCRPEFVAAMERPLQLCHYTGVKLLAPFLHMTKGQIAQVGELLGVPFDLTWTCYEGGDVHCGRCGACQERLEAFRSTELGDPVEYARAA